MTNKNRDTENQTIVTECFLLFSVANDTLGSLSDDSQNGRSNETRLANGNLFGLRSLSPYLNRKLYQIICRFSRHYLTKNTRRGKKNDRSCTRRRQCNWGGLLDFGWYSYQPEELLITCSWDYTSRIFSNRLLRSWIRPDSHRFAVLLLSHFLLYLADMQKDIATDFDQRWQDEFQPFNNIVCRALEAQPGTVAVALDHIRPVLFLPTRQLFSIFWSTDSSIRSSALAPVESSATWESALGTQSLSASPMAEL